MMFQPIKFCIMNRQHLPPRLLCLLLLLCAVGVRAQTYGLQYWFDQKGNHKPKIMTVSFSGPVFNRDVDVSNLESGFHTVNIRIKATDGTYSPVTSSTFIKFTASTSSNLEYWFDDDYAKHATMPINANTETMQILDLDFSDQTRFPLGFHRLNYRVVANGNYSPVYSDYVMRLPEGEHSEITYWLDDEYDPANIRVLSGRGMTETTALVKGSLDFSMASKGMHRLHYRITANGFDNGVIYEVPVLITEKYNKVAATVVAESKWMDDEFPAPFTISNPSEMVTRSYTLYAKDYDEGQHVFHVQYQNSAEVWGEPNATYFYKEASGAMKVGIMPTDIDGIDDVEQSGSVLCSYEQGTIYIDCLSPRLASTGIVTVTDVTGKTVARQTVSNSDGIHAQLNVQAFANQLLIVRLTSGNVTLIKKLFVK